MNCSTAHASTCILKQNQALIDTTNNKSPAVLKKKCSGASKNKKKGGGGPKPPVGVIPPPPSPPSKEVDTTINRGSLLILLCFPSLCFYSFYLIVVFVLVTHEIRLFLTSRWSSRLVFACFIVSLLFVHCYSPFSIDFYCRAQPNAWFTYGGLTCSLQPAIQEKTFDCC